MKTGRNDPCPCGSGLKFKKCCESSSKSASGANSDNLPDTGEKLALAISYHQSNQLDRAAQLYQEIIQQEPANGNALHLLGVIEYQRGDFPQAAELIKKALALLPRVAEIHVNLGNVYKDMGRKDDAVASYRKALKINPLHGSACYNLGVVLHSMLSFTEAGEYFRKALTQQPQLAAEIYGKLGNISSEQCKISDSINYYKKALALDPGNSELHSSMLMTYQYDQAQTLASLHSAHLEWARLHEQPAQRFTQYANEPAPLRTLHIGYVSADFCRHPIGYFLLPVINAHDRNKVKVFCYSNRSDSDDMTEQLRARAECWSSIAGKSPLEVAEQVRADGIDILVDLAGHTASNCLRLFALKPAPLQVTWAGYTGTTGLSTIDYIISDSCETPEGTDQWYTERIIRLPGDYLCYTPPEYAPEVGQLPVLSAGGITFGCFNSLLKVNEAVISLWIRILHKLPAAKLLLITRQLGDPEISTHYRKMFAAAGVAKQVEFRGALAHKELLECYNEIDIALDPFPYSGGLSTLESLWMGVPVVTKAGTTFAGRHSASHLSVVGLPELIAETADEYLDIAFRLANDLPRLSGIRSGLRTKMIETVCDGSHFTRGLEAAFREIWTAWCEKNNAENEVCTSERFSSAE
jgi:predicted O-linked N-acetylglucosamine transferase (SPINDLY family)